MTILHDHPIGQAGSCVAALVAGWGSYLATAQSILGLVAAIAATVYSIYMSYDLWDRRRKRQ